MLTYTSFVSQLTNAMPVASSSDAGFTTMLPGAIDYVEGRLYRDLDLPSVRVTDTSVTCASGVRSIALSTTQGTLLAIETINLFTPAGATSSNATRVPIVPTSKATIDAVYPSAASSNCGLPTFAARVTDTQIMFGPTPDQAYGTEVIATIRPSPLSSGNSSTWLTQNVPELFFAGAMVFVSGWMKDFGAQSDNPQLAQSWESQYTALLKSAGVDALRMKFQSVAWSNQAPSPIATPPRA